MSYTKTTWVNNTTPINETNLNKIEQGIYDNSLVVDAVTNTLNPTDTETYKTAELTEGQITDVIAVNDVIIKGQTSQNGEPTPDSPVDVNVVSGSNVINISNKNLAQHKSGYIKYSTGVFYSSNDDCFYFPVVKGETYYCTSTGNRTVGAIYNNVPVNGQACIAGTTIDNIPKNGSFVANATGIMVIYANTPTSQSVIDTFMITRSSTATTYEQHQGKELPLDLGSIELCKIGDYQDYFYKESNKWYLHKEIGKVVLNGSESDWTRESYSEQYYYRLLTNIPNQSNGFSNYFTVIAYSAGLLSHTNSLRINNSYLDIVTDKSNTSLDDFKTWLSTHNTIVYYELATPTDTEITDTTLISQLEAIYNAPLYEQTNITQTNNDLPMILDITACKDNINGIKAFIRK